MNSSLHPSSRWGGVRRLLPRWAPPLLVLALLSCNGNPPPGPPEPPEPDPQPKYMEMLLRADGPSGFKTIEGVPVKFRGAISCCMPDDWGGDSGWPFNVHPEWQDYAGFKGNANFFHARLGPFMAGPGAEPLWEGIGGPYALAPDGRADLTQWNPKFWDTAKDYVEYAAERGRYVEVDLIDGWYCKHGIWGDVKMPWMAQFNIQNEQWVGRCGREPIVEGTVFDNWLAKVVSELGPYGNVIWQDGNEVALIPGYIPEWSVSMRERVRHYEKTLGLNVVHMFGTNSHHPDPRLVSDYIEVHTGGSPLQKPQFGKISGVNEYNPRPPISPENWRRFYCAAEQFGTLYWYWRHGQSFEDMEQTLAYMAEPCDDVNVEGCPYDVQTPAKVKVGFPWGPGVGDATPIICNRAYCARAGWTDGRGCCAVRQEGDYTRKACEFKAMGGQISYWLTEKEGDIGIVVSKEGFGFQVTGHGRAVVNCTFPTANGAQKCRLNSTSNPVVIAR